MLYIFLADGFEETEAVATIDVIRRAGIPLKTVGVGAAAVVSARGIAMAADMLAEDIDPTDIDGVILPGGMPGTVNLEKSEAVIAALDYAYNDQKLIAAICAAPSVLGHRGMLRGVRATCFPGFENELEGAVAADEYVCTDGRFITGRGPGVAFDFGLAIVRYMRGADAAAKIRASLQCAN